LFTTENILKGYESDEQMPSLVASLCSILQDRSLPLFEYNEIIASISGRIPAELDVKLREILQQGLDTTSGIDMNRIENEMQKVLENSSPDSRATFSVSMEPLFAWIDKFKPGMEAVYSSTLISILKSYMDIESYFDNKSEADAMTTLRQQFKTESPKIFEMALASTKRETRSSLILAVLEVIDREQTESSKKVFGPIIRDLANLNSARASKVSLRAREMVISNQQPSFLERKESMLNILKDAVKESKNLVHNLDPRSFAKLVTGNHAILDILSDLFYHPKKEINACALFTYVLHTYQAYSTRNLKTHLSEQHVALSWEFNVRNANAASKVVNSNTATGLICAFESLENISTELEALALPIYCEESAKTKAIPAHILNIAVRSSSRLENDSEAQQIFQELAKSMNALFTKCHLKRVTFMVIQENQFPRYFTFKESKRYEEDLVIRHTEPAMAHRLELSRMSNYDIKPCFIDNRRVHIYHGTAKSNPHDTRFFVRAIIHPGQAKESVTPAEFLVSEGSKIIADVLDAVELLSAGQYRNTDCNHVLLSFIQTFSLDLEKLEMGVRDIIRRHRNRLFKLRITEAEIRFSRLNPNTKVAKTTRFVISSNSGFVIQLGVYQEVRDANGVQTLMTVSSPPGPLHNMPVESPYPIKEKVQPKRQKAHALGTTYIYDFPELFKGALKRLWTNYVDGEGMKPPTVLVNYRELVLNSMGELEESNNPPGSNTCGMVAWEMELLTPEYPEGRHIIVIGNDITFNIGSFGPIEDLLFLKASQLARQRGIPRVYISANSGARIGLADEVSDKFKIEWIDPQNPSRGFKYLYLDEADYQKLNHDKPVVIGHKVEDDGRIKYRLDSIIGKEHGLGVENLQGSGQIAGETSRAYDEIFTITLVTCRSVGNQKLI
jgi:acetyl-CoA carboxylase/biotin carboxylase 1